MRIVAGLVALALLTDPALAEPNPPPGKTETRLFWLDSCPVGDPIRATDPAAYAAFLVPLITALITPFVGAVVDKGVAALQEAAKDKDFPVPAPAGVEESFYEIGSAGEVSLGPRIHCVALVRGRFLIDSAKKDSIHASATVLQRLAARFRADPVEVGEGDATDTATRIGGEPEFYFEARVIGSPDGSKFALRPQALHVGKFFAEGSGKQRHYAATLTFVDAYQNQPFASSEFRFEGVTAGESITACQDVPRTAYCGDSALGGTRGWYPTKPRTPELDAELAGRKRIALAIHAASKAWTEPEKGPEADGQQTSSALADFCLRLDDENERRLPSLREYDPECPAALAAARTSLELARQRDALNLRWKSGRAIWAKRYAEEEKLPTPEPGEKLPPLCGPVPGPNEPDPARRAAECLKALQPSAAGGPFRLRATLIETRPGSRVAKFFAPIAESAAPAAKSALVSAVDPAARAAAKRTRKTVMRAQRVAIAKADLDVQIAQVGVTKAAASGERDAVLKAQLALLDKQVSANEAHRAGGLEVPFPDVD